MPRRITDYSPTDGFTTLNEISSIGAFLPGASTLPFLYNAWKSRKGPLVGLDDPWGRGRSVEWATSSPPPRHNFLSLPRIRSESPAFDLHHPEIAALELVDNPGETSPFADAPDVSGKNANARGAGGGEDAS